MTSSNPGMFFSSGALKGLMSSKGKKKTSRKVCIHLFIHFLYIFVWHVLTYEFFLNRIQPATTEGYQTEVDMLVQSILKQETGRDNIPKNQWYVFKCVERVNKLHILNLSRFN
jgi:hypothetical protein